MYTVTAHNKEGQKITNLGKFVNIVAARQSMLDHSNTIDLPNEDPLFLPEVGVLEGWFIGKNEYLISA